MSTRDDLMAHHMPGETFAALDVEFLPERQRRFWLLSKSGKRVEVSADDARAIHLEAAHDLLLSPTRSLTYILEPLAIARLREWAHAWAAMRPATNPNPTMAVIVEGRGTLWREPPDAPWLGLYESEGGGMA